MDIFLYLGPFLVSLRPTPIQQPLSYYGDHHAPYEVYIHVLKERIRPTTQVFIYNVIRNLGKRYTFRYAHIERVKGGSPRSKMF